MKGMTSAFWYQQKVSLMFSRMLATGAVARSRTADAAAYGPAECQAGQVQAIIFNKDGTLFDLPTMWGEWCLDMIQTEAQEDPILMAQMAEVLGLDPVE